MASAVPKDVVVETAFDVNSAPELPLGLTQLMIPGVLVKQKHPDVLSRGCRYDVFNLDMSLILRGEEVRRVTEDHKERPFKITFYDNRNNEIAQLIRPRPNTFSKLLVKVSGETVSIVREKATVLDSVLYINDADDLPEMRLKGLSGSHEHQLLSCYQKNISFGSVKRCDLCVPSIQLGVNYYPQGYYVQFPHDMSVHYKIAVIGATILLDFMTNYRKMG